MSEDIQDDGLQELDNLLAAARQRPPEVKTRGDSLNEALDVTLLAMSGLSEDQLQTLYDHLVGELVSRGIDEEITGNTNTSAADHSLDAEMQEVIGLVASMRNNLSRQVATGKAVSNREIRETIGACVNAIKLLTSHQKTVRNVERQRMLELTLIEVLGEYNDEMQAEFLARFRERLDKVQK